MEAKGQSTVGGFIILSTGLPSYTFDTASVGAATALSNNYVVRSSSTLGLTNGVLQDNGSTAGTGTLEANVSFTISNAGTEAPIGISSPARVEHGTSYTDHQTLVAWLPIHINHSNVDGGPAVYFIPIYS